MSKLLTRRRALPLALCCGLVLLLSRPMRGYAQQPTATAAQNKQLIQKAFARWAGGNNDFFDLLADDVQWTITGSSAYAKTYTGKPQFLREAAAPLTSRLATPLRPQVRGLYADGDVVVALWDGTATAKDGQPYRNTYCWTMTMKNGRITQVVALLDMAAYEDVIRRIPAGG